MGKANIINPIYFFTGLSYETNSHEENQEVYSGEYNAEIYYDFEELKTGKKENGVAFHNTPYYPANIMVAKNAINLKDNGEGEYEIDKTISYDECLQAIQSLQDKGLSLSEVNSDLLRKELKNDQNMVKTI